MKFYAAFDKEGRVNVRSSASREYTHCIMWANSWCGSAALAQKHAGPGVVIAEAKEVTRKEFMALREQEKRDYAARRAERAAQAAA